MSDCQCGQCGHRGDGSGFTTGLLLGLVTGAASAHFLLNTEKGRELLENLKENAGETLRDLGDNPALMEKITDLQKTMDKARATINQGAEKVTKSSKKNFFQKMGASLGK